jgi:hypothetical protein
VLFRSEVTSVVFVDGYSFWVFNLFVSLYLWRSKGIPVIAYLTRTANLGGAHNIEEENYRRRLLRLLGVNVIEVERIPFNGVGLNVLDLNETTSILIRLPKSADSATRIVRYDGYFDTFAIRQLLQVLDLDSVRTNADFQPSLVPGGYDELFRRLRRVPQYSQEGIEVELSTINVSQVLSVTKKVKEHKYLQIERLVKHLSQHDHRLFEILNVSLDGGQTSIMAPPVLEEWGGQFVLIEGTARLLFCRLNRIEQIRAVVVRPRSNTPLPDLPDAPLELRRIRMVGREYPDQRWERGYSHVRNIEAQIHRPDDLAS